MKREALDSARRDCRRAFVEAEETGGHDGLLVIHVGSLAVVKTARDSPVALPKAPAFLITGKLARRRIDRKTRADPETGQVGVSARTPAGLETGRKTA